MKKKKILRVVILFLLVFVGVFFAYHIIPRTAMSLNIKFTDSPPVTRNFLTGTINAYYRGYKVGNVSTISLSTDQKYIVFHLDIHYKNLRLPKNSAFILKSEPFFGSTSRYFSISYPKRPSSQLLADGDTIYGTASYQGLDQYLVEELPRGSARKLVTNLIILTDSLKYILKNNGDVKDTLTEIQKLSASTNYIINEITEFIDDPELKQELKKTIRKSPENIDKVVKSLEITTETLPEINKNMQSVNKNIVATNGNIFRTNESILKTNTSIIRADNTISDTNCNIGSLNSKIPQIPPELLNNTSEALETLNCVGNELSEMLNKRFLLLRFMFGKPASSISRCLEDNPGCKVAPDVK